MKAIKEIFIAIVVLCIIIITTGLVLYNFVATQKNIPSIEKYSKDAKVVSLTTDKVEDGTVNATVNRKTYELDTSTLDKSRRFASGKSNPFANTSITDGKTTNTNSGVTESRENTENNNENNKENKEPSTGVNIFKNKSNGKKNLREI